MGGGVEENENEEGVKSQQEELARVPSNYIATSLSMKAFLLRSPRGSRGLSSSLFSYSEHPSQKSQPSYVVIKH